MVKMIRNWIIKKAPIWAKASLEAENRKLQDENRKLSEEILRLNAYIDGLQYGSRSMRRIIINTAGENK